MHFALRGLLAGLMIFVILKSSVCQGQSQNTPGKKSDSEAYWEYGAGFGYVTYAHYPASNQSSNLFLPFPTFQYRGEILRADDRDGAHVYLLKSTGWSLEISGTGYIPLDSSKNEARRDMENLPLVGALGPQLLSAWKNDFQFGFGIYQGLSTDLKKLETRGQVFEFQTVYRWDAELGLKYFEKTYGRLAFTATAATKEFLGTYFDVGTKDVSATRNFYDSRGGYLSHNLSYFQSFKAGFAAFYLGLSLTDYGLSANRQSPLHKSDQNFHYLAGFTYVFGRSARPEVPDEDTSGLFNNRRGLGPF